MICKNCGAEFDEQLARCPYCNTMNEAGAKRKFYHKIKRMAHSVDSMAEVPQKTMIRLSGRLLAVAGICVVIIIAVLWGKKVIHNNKLRAEVAEQEAKLQEKAEWEDATFPKFDALYEAGEYDKLFDVFLKIYEEDNEIHRVWGWRHSQFMQIYGDYSTIKDFKKAIEIENGTKESSHKYVLYFSICFYYDYTKEQLASYIPEDIEHSSWGLTNQELILIEQYRQDVKEYIMENYDMTQEDMDELHQKCITSKDPYKVCGDYIKEFMKK